MSDFSTGIPNIRVVIRENTDDNLALDVPSISVNIQKNTDYNVNIVPTAVTPIRTGSWNRIADVALTAISSSYALTASYALNAGAGSGFPFSGSAVITGSLQVDGPVTATSVTSSLYGSVQSSQLEINAGQFTVLFTGSINTGIFGVSEYIYPYISTTRYSGMVVEYLAQRTGACRMGIIMAAWLNTASVIFTDVSTTDIGDTSDISFKFLSSSNELRLRVSSEGSGSGAWTVQSLFKLFPNLNP
jgi:hypothetical protein